MLLMKSLKFLTVLNLALKALRVAKKALIVCFLKSGRLHLDYYAGFNGVLFLFYICTLPSMSWLAKIVHNLSGYAAQITLLVSFLGFRSIRLWYFHGVACWNFPIHHEVSNFILSF